MADYSSSGVQADLWKRSSNGGSGQIFDSTTGQSAAMDSPAGQAILSRLRSRATQTGRNVQAVADAQIGVQETQDRMAENKQRQEAMSGLAFANARRQPGMGRGLYSRKTSGVRPNTVLTDLTGANAAAVAASKRAQVAATMKLDPSGRMMASQMGLIARP